jgi:O-antigen ligase
LTLPPWLIVAAGLFVALIAGAACAVRPALGLAVVAACAFVPLALLSLPLALAAWIPIAWSEYSHVAGRAPVAGLLLLAVAWIGTRSARDAVAADERSVRIARVALALLLVWLTLSIGWAGDRSDAWKALLQWYLAAGTFVLVSTVATTRTRARLIALAFVVGALASVAVGLLGLGEETTTSGALDLATRQRFSGGAGDPNYLAAGLVAAIALAVGLAPWARRALRKLALALSAVALGTAMLATESRGGLIAAVAAMVAAALLARKRRVAFAASCGVVGLAVAIVLLVSPGSLERLQTFDPGGTGRSDLWRVAARIADDHPIAGVGLAGFGHESKHYVLRPGSLTFVKTLAERPDVAHSVYLQQLAETGVVGLLGLLVFLAACLFASQAAARRFRASGDHAMAALAVATTVAMIGMLTASLFISNATDKRLWVVLALGPALLAAAGPPKVSPPAQTGRALPSALPSGPP